ncbi:MAG: hypothetical protein JKY66_05995 [Spongiibacteraceae bacterium]|nr:hypothetical protein [Spongiibacteraceae bacterium]
MNESDSTQSAPPALPYSELLKHTTALCDELNDLMALHHFFYQASEHFFPSEGLSFRRGLSLFPSWLRERDIGVLESINQIQETIRAAKYLQNTQTVS